jgi:uncharacterized SAM-binding protein YcdF (DUF218 family)
MAEGAVIGIALWCVAFAFQLLPGFTADSSGVFCFLIVGAAIGATRGLSVLRWFTALGAAVVVLITTTDLSGSLARRWVRVDPAMDSVGAVVVLSGGVNPDSTINAFAADRLLTALELLRGDTTTTLITTHVEQRFDGLYVSSDADQARLIGLLGGKVRWTRVSAGHSTHDEAVATAGELLPRGTRRIAVVTSPLHTRRACSTFEAVGFTVTCVPARTRTPGGALPASWPRDQLATFGDLVYELLGSVEYRARGWTKTTAAR